MSQGLRDVDNLVRRLTGNRCCYTLTVAGRPDCATSDTRVESRDWCSAGQSIYGWILERDRAMETPQDSSDYSPMLLPV
jgi:hypothetical protein